MNSKKSRCKCIINTEGDKCNKKLKLTDMDCKCEITFCGSHRLPENHNCAYNYIAEGRKLLKQQNPVIEHIKIIPV